MRRNEILLLGMVALGLVFTAFTLYQQEPFDCTQPLFSETSSCSVAGTACVALPDKYGLSGLWDFVLVADGKKKKGSACAPPPSAPTPGTALFAVDSATGPLIPAGE
ncbi:MAG TPA: hypothetical protein DCE41_20640 [Cytophagales bacterium]|nr:hypothetical protein [Cytophagales bacterium]HAP59010.1 hypothetical protein [Cytophagales bacterium]